MSRRVTFSLPVDVDESLLSDDPSQEEVVDTAEEILRTAPAFDDVPDHVVDSLDVADVDAE